MLHHFLVEHIDQRLKEATDSIISNYPINDLTATEVYEDLVGNPIVLAAFRNAAQYMQRSDLVHTVDICVKNYTAQEVRVVVNLPPTDKDQHYILPQTTRFINSRSKLWRALQAPVQVATEWAMLQATWDRMRRAVDDPAALVFLMPWIRELANDLASNQTPMPQALDSKKNYNEAMRDLKKLRGRTVPNRLPSMTRELNEVCKSGNRLFAQYRMLYASKAFDSGTPMVRVVSANSLCPAWLSDDLDEVIENYLSDQGTFL